MESNFSFNLPEEEVSVAAYYVWEKEQDYGTLCWLLAEREMYLEKGFTIPSKLQIMKRAEQIFNERPPYDVLCWHIGKLNLIIDKKKNSNSYKSDLPEELK
jgi:hypothetical protein